MKRSRDREPFFFNPTATGTSIGVLPSPPINRSVDLQVGGFFGRVLKEVNPGSWGSDSTATLKLELGELVRINLDVENSVDRYIVVERLSDGQKGTLPSSYVELIPSERDRVYKCWLSGAARNDAGEQIDMMFSSEVSYSSSLCIEPGLDSLIFPLQPSEFLARFLAKKALCVHASPSRLSPTLSSDFLNFSVTSLLVDASRVVVWMRESGGLRRMQYLDSSPEVGAACYAAGHSLYFNPSLSVQQRYLSALCEDLGMDFGARFEGEGSFGGDVEIFAVAGSHSTPWHFDAQENFTLQIKGTKRWRLARGPHTGSPLTNYHPLSSSDIQEDARVLLTSGGVGGSSLTPPPQDSPGDACFYLRPGSFLYVPAGMWHAVDAEGEEGSLSINFSVCGVRWGDILLRAISQKLWGEAELRERVVGISSEGGGGGGHGVEFVWKKIAHLLQSTIPAALSAISPPDVLPRAAFSAFYDPHKVLSGEVVDAADSSSSSSSSPKVARNASSVLLEEEEGEESHKIPSSSSFSRGKLTVMTLAGNTSSPSFLPSSFSLHSGFAGGGFGAGGELGKGGGGIKWKVDVPPCLSQCLLLVYNLKEGGSVSMEELRDLAGTEGSGQLEEFIGVLCNCGYLTRH